jgi:GAF domain-containing protein
MGGKPWDILALGAPGAPNGEMRHLTYKAMGLSDAPPCAELDVVLQALCSVFQAPYGSLALYTEGRCWLVSTVAMPGGDLSWRVSACPWNLLVPQPQTLVCGDLKEDARFENQPWTLSGLRCYCSAPLLATNGHRLGTICFMDKEPRV